MAADARDAARPEAGAAVGNLARFTETFGDLADPEVMSSAWRQRTGITESGVRRAIGVDPDQEEEQPATTEQSAPDDDAEPAPRPKQPSSRPEQSAEDTDSGWGERPDPDHDERLYGDRPPHWDSL